MSVRSGRHGTEEMKAARAELHNLLVKKLVARYGKNETGHGVPLHPVNHLIQAEVDLFMYNHSKVQAGDLSHLERTVRSATKAEGMRHHRQQVHTSRSAATSRSGTSRSSGAPTYWSAASSRGGCTDRTPQGVEHARQQSGGNGNGKESSPSRSRPRPSTTRSVSSRSRQKEEHHAQQPSGRRSLSSSRGCGSMDDGNIGIPTNIKNEWLILETYQQVMADEKQAEEDRRAQSAIQRFKQDLDKQIQLNKSRSEEEKRDAEARKEQQRKQLEEHEAHQKELKESSRRKLLEEKCVRASQILDNERRRARERQEQKLDDARLLAECKQKLAEEKEAQLQKRNEVARLLREMNRENVAKLALREKQKLKEAEEDKRLMKEYQERLDREQAERAAAHKKRLERYEMIGNQWAEFGAGKKQHDKDVAEERRVLAEAAIKEKADQDREKRDKEALRADRLRCLEDNKRLMDEKVARKKAEDLLEAKYAQQFRSEGEEHAAKDVARKNQMLRQKQDHARKLKDQMRATRAALKTVQMTDTERQMNGDLLRQLQENRDLQEKISRRLLQEEPLRAN